MTILAAPAAVALLQAAATARDTVLVRPLPPVRSAVEQVFFYASGVTAILTLVLVLMLVVALFWMRRAAVAAGQRVDELFDELRPMLKQAAETAESVRETADLIQEEVALVKDGVNETGVRVKQTVGELADRVDDFNDLLGKMHSRADAVVGVAGSAMDGIAWGARKLRERKQKRLKKKA
jgi:methyl-accepting chemotaxis protein